MACFCACSRCLAGDCCMLKPWPWWWTGTYPSTTTWTNTWGTGAPMTIEKTCPKCGEVDLKVKWHRSEYVCSIIGAAAEHLHYTCQTCDYDWSEPSNDAKLKAAVEEVKKAPPTTDTIKTTITVPFDEKEVAAVVRRELDRYLKTGMSYRVVSKSCTCTIPPATAASGTASGATWQSVCPVHGTRLYDL